MFVDKVIKCYTIQIRWIWQMLPMIVDVPKLELGCTIIIYYYITLNIMYTLKTVILSKSYDLTSGKHRAADKFLLYVIYINNIRYHLLTSRLKTNTNMWKILYSHSIYYEQYNISILEWRKLIFNIKQICTYSDFCLLQSLLSLSSVSLFL